MHHTTGSSKSQSLWRGSSADKRAKHKLWQCRVNAKGRIAPHSEQYTISISRHRHESRTQDLSVRWYVIYGKSKQDLSRDNRKMQIRIAQIRPLFAGKEKEAQSLPRRGHAMVALDTRCKRFQRRMASRAKKPIHGSRKMAQQARIALSHSNASPLTAIGKRQTMFTIQSFVQIARLSDDRLECSLVPSRGATFGTFNLSQRNKAPVR